MLNLGSVNVPNFSWMVAILVHHHVPILDNGRTGLIPGPVMYEDDEKLAEPLTGPGISLE